MYLQNSCECKGHVWTHHLQTTPWWLTCLQQFIQFVRFPGCHDLLQSTQCTLNKCKTKMHVVSFVWFLFLWSSILPISVAAYWDVVLNKVRKFRAIWAWNIPLWEKVHHWRTRADLTQIVAFMLFLHVVFVIMQAPFFGVSCQLHELHLCESVVTVLQRVLFFLSSRFLVIHLFILSSLKPM